MNNPGSFSRRMLARAAASGQEREMRWHHLVMAVGNFKRQGGRRLRPARISPASGLTCTARAGQFSVPGSSAVSCEDAASWKLLQDSLPGSAAATTTALLAALWPDRHHILDWRVLAAVAGLGLAAGGDSDPGLVTPGSREQLTPTLGHYAQVRTLLISESIKAGVQLRTAERALYVMSRAVSGRGTTWAEYGDRLRAAAHASSAPNPYGMSDGEEDTPPAAP